MKIKCECANCHYIQWIDRLTTESCEKCSFDINSNYDQYEE